MPVSVVKIDHHASGGGIARGLAARQRFPTAAVFVNQALRREELGLQRDLVYMQRIASWEDHHLVKAEEEYTTAHRPVQHGKLAVRPDKPFVAG